MIGLVVADVVWPALDLAGSYWAWWVILAGLAVEFAVLRSAFRMPLRQALYADVVMNAASATVGLGGLAMAGLAWEYFPGSLLYRALDDATFVATRWVCTLLLATAINTVVEGAVLSEAFDVPLTLRRIAALVGANAVTIGMACAELWFHPPQH